MILFKDQGDLLHGSARNRKAQQIQHSSKPTPSIPAKHDVEEAAPTSIITEPDLSVYQREPSPAPNDAAITRECNAQSEQEPLDAEPTKGLSDVPTLNVNHAKLVTSFMRIVEDIKLIQIEHSEEFDEPLESEYGRARTGIFEYLCQAQSPLPTGSLQILRGNSKDGPSGRPCIRIIHGDFGDQKKLTNFHLKFSHQRKQYDPPFTICYQTLWDLSGITAEQSTTEPTQDLLERMVKTGELCGHLESPLVAARYHDQTEFEEDHDEFVNGDGLEFLKSAGSIRFTGSEWALIQVDNDFLKLPNCVRADVEPRPAHNNVIQETSIRPPQRALRYLTHAYRPGDMAQTSNVLVLAGVSGEIKTTISRQLSAMRLDSGKVVQVWTLSFAGIKGSSLKKGDSGSWVVHPESGAVFGHIIAGTYRNAFVLPLDTIMREIGGCVLPTPFDCLADLARAYHTEGNTELAEQFAVKAMQENVLLVSSKGSELSRLIKARGRRPFDPSQPYSALQPAEVFRVEIPYLRWERESHRESIAAWVKTEHNRRRSPVAQDEHGLNFSGRKSQMSSSQNERRFIPTKLGRLLLNAAALYEAISLDSEKQLLQNSLSRPEPFHLRRTLYQAYGTPQVDVDRSGLTSNFGSGNDNTNAVMVDQLWMRIIDGKTVVTSFPNNFGRDLADPTSIYHCIRQRLEEDAKLINIKAYDIALIVIEECLSSFFKQNQTPATAPAIAPGGISSISEIISSLVRTPAFATAIHVLLNLTI
ncbi:ankyrin repeat protein [Colletotrichum kahawae]|uniref:Ankyrin repeat protein n=1 Tax=Colletotrichum kahawae TaxID=34407 RepID=A0AAE0D6U0_COLKA|nr:ankyrin repeat protein [Colletotrichum kahawae]